MSQDPPTEIDTLAQLADLATTLRREIEHMRRQRRVVAWVALLLAIAAGVALFSGQKDVSSLVLLGLQSALWSTIALMNFAGPGWPFREPFQEQSE